MSTVIAFCTDAAVFSSNKILEEDCAKNYPGTLWVSCLARLAKDYGIEVVTGDIALCKVQSGEWNASDILVIQEECAVHGANLVKLGSVPFALFCLESPLYARKFYAHLVEQSKKFKNRILFRGVFYSLSQAGIDHVVYFPSYSLEIKEEKVPWNNKKFLVMVAANKYWRIKRPAYRQIIAWIRDVLWWRRSYITQEIIDNQLHDKRLELIEYFMGEECLDLYGTGWQNLSNLPKSWEIRLEKIIKKLKPAPCIDKYTIVSHYKFALCLENMSYPGYITEKIIDCFRAGVIPIYMGAPDISDFVPTDAFVDLRDFHDYSELNNQLKSMSAETSLAMIDAGRLFLDSKYGREFSFEMFAKNVMNMVEKYK